MAHHFCFKGVNAHNISCNMYRKKKLTFTLHPSPILFLSFSQELSHRGTPHQFLIIFNRFVLFQELVNKFAQGLNDVIDDVRGG
jgi:hypothetical protein